MIVFSIAGLEANTVLSLKEKKEKGLSLRTTSILMTIVSLLIAAGLL